VRLNKVQTRIRRGSDEVGVPLLALPFDILEQKRRGQLAMKTLARASENFSWYSQGTNPWPWSLLDTLVIKEVE
jgi:hypothetical protein